VIILGLRQLQLHHDAAHVLFDRPLGHPELVPDPGVRPAFRHQRQHFTLARGQDPERITGAAGSDQFVNQHRIHHGGAADDPLHGLDEFRHVEDAALEQVAAALPAGQQVQRVLHLDMCRKDQDRGLRELSTDRARRVQALGGVARRHPDVHDDKVGPPVANQRDELRGISALAYDVKAGALEQARQALAEQDVVVRKRNPGAVHGHYHDYRPAPPSRLWPGVMVPGTMPALWFNERYRRW
jgi:hypothetical protein